MNQQAIERVLANRIHNIDHVVVEVAERGIVENSVEGDRFEDLRTRREYRDVIIGEFYETYFLPDRHEFDWHLLSELVEGLTEPNTVSFVKQAAVGGVVGAAAWEVCRTILRAIVRAMRSASFSDERIVPYDSMLVDAKKIEKFFDSRDSARIAEIEDSTGVARERLYPFLKLMGFTHQRRKHNCLWCTPGFFPRNA